MQSCLEGKSGNLALTLYAFLGSLPNSFFISVPGTKVAWSPFDRPQHEATLGTVFLRYLFLFIYLLSFGFPKGTQLKMTSLRGKIIPLLYP